MRSFLTFLAEHGEDSLPWGTPNVRKEFEAPNVARKFEKILSELQ